MFGIFKKQEKTISTPTRKWIGNKPVVLIIMDGLGIHANETGNAVLQAKTPFLDVAWSKGLKTQLHASGVHVGLPELEPGNSEVGHLNIGAGRVVYQSLPRISDAIRNGKFHENEQIKLAFDTAKKRGKKIHLMGILSNGGVHGHIEHLNALLDICKINNVSPYVHAFLDGRDTGFTSGIKFVEKLNQKFAELQLGQLASIGGRFYGMDRDKRWDRTQLAYDSIVGRSPVTTTNPAQYVQDAYDKDENDQILTPATVVDENGYAVGAVSEGDVMIFYNFREDRARQITKAFVIDGFEHIEQAPGVHALHFVTMTGYEEGLPTNVVFPPKKIFDPIAKVLSDQGRKQLHISETEKYMHISYFFNGGIEEPHPGEEQFNIPSPRVFDYAETPEMSSEIIRDEILYRLKRIEKFDYSFIVANLANPDMLGHTGNLEKAVEAVQITDTIVKDISEATLAAGGSVVLIADHGNCETMINRSDGSINTSHTSNPVPLIILGSLDQIALGDGIEVVKFGSGDDVYTTGMLADVAPTILSMLGMDIPETMTGINLLEVL